MTHNATTVLVDTNVWIDNFLGARSTASSSRAFLDEAYKRNVNLVYPVHALKDVFYLLQQALKTEAKREGAFDERQANAIREIAWGCIQNMREVAVAVGADESDAWLACKYRTYSGDLEDNFVMAAAERAKVDYLVTNDQNLARKATVPAYTPEDALALMGVTRF